MADAETDATKAAIADFAHGLSHEDLPGPVAHAAKGRIIDALGALYAGFAAGPCVSARALAQSMGGTGATIIGTRMRTSPDMAAYVNGITSRHAELIDAYHFPGSYYGHPGDVTLPILTAAEFAGASGRALGLAIVAGYEIFLRMSDKFANRGFDFTNFGSVAVAAAAGQLFGLSRAALGDAVAMAATSGLTLRQVRDGQLSAFKSAATGVAGRHGVFCALLAREGMSGPALPFAGRYGWAEHVARGPFSLDPLGQGSFKILEAQMKPRPAAGNAISSILAAEAVTPLDPDSVASVTVETYRVAKANMGTAEHCWDPQSRETADHSIPYVVAVTLFDGRFTLESFSDSRLWNPKLRALMKKIEVTANDDFSKDYERYPQDHRTRVTVRFHDGGVRVGETGGATDWGAPPGDAQISEKFLALTGPVLGENAAADALARLWDLEDAPSLGEIIEGLAIPALR